MWYHWSEDNLFFQNLVIPKLVERKSLIEKVHQEIGHFGEMKTLDEIKKHFFGIIELNLLRHLARFVKNVKWLNNLEKWDLVLKRWKVFQFVIFFIKLFLISLDHYLRLLLAISMCLKQLTIIQNVWGMAFKDHDALIGSKFLEDEMIYRYGVPKCIFHPFRYWDWMDDFFCWNMPELWHRPLVHYSCSALVQWHGWTSHQNY